MGAQIESLPPQERPRRVLIVDDDEARRMLFAKVLRCEGYDVDQLSEGTGLVERMRAHPPDLVLLDVLLPDVSGFELCGDLRMTDETRQTPIILLTSAFLDEESVVRGLLAGADDYIVTPSRLDELRARVRVQLRNRRDRELLQWARSQGATLRVAAMEDGLTGLPNRRAVDRALDTALARGERLLVVSIDVDRFKAINDAFGHPMGDCVLGLVAKALASSTRAGDLAARYGGEEFLVMVPGASLEVAGRIGDRYRNAVRSMALPPGAPSFVSVSIGIAGTDGSGPVERAALLAAADAALYEAKRSGRDRVVVDMIPVLATCAKRDEGGAT